MTTTKLLLSVCDWLYNRGHKSAATDLDCNWNDGPPGDGSCLKLREAESRGARSVASAGDGREVWVTTDADGTPVGCDLDEADELLAALDADNSEKT